MQCLEGVLEFPLYLEGVMLTQGAVSLAETKSCLHLPKRLKAVA